jgi:lipoprotein-anchoring transpeptidase ErfK/SrfK
MQRYFGRTVATLAASALLLAGCVGSDAEREPTADAVTAQTGDAPLAQPRLPPGQQAQTQQSQAQPQAPPDMRLEVNIAARELYVYKGGRRVATHPVAVGSQEWPTPTGEWTIGQVIWNPRWIPPEEEWAKDEEVKEPGAPDNPLGRAQLVYSPPNTIHGTNDTTSLGKAVSHGSIRVANEVAMDLARQVMEAGGAGKDEAWYRQARQNRTERRDVNIPNPVPIRVVSGGGSGRSGG